jgi:methylmalonyl-CoA mutase
LAEAAWERFKSLEADGGMAAALVGGRMTAEAEAAWSARLLRLATRGEALTGVSEFPDIDELALVRSPGAPSPAGPLPLRRLAEPFEALRDAAEASDVEPTVVLVALGPVAGRAERAAFVVNLFEVGGIRVLDGGGSVASATGVVSDSGCRLAVVCGSDDPSADEAGETGEAAAALRAAGVDRVYRVGRDGGIAGIDEVLHPGIDVLGVLGRALDVLGLVRSAP